ncbi:hypothetical protein [Streptomyces sp. NPDC059850]|uniref:hypothetical protein n=1 Tax=Streptomyces sp. NPDC059850 TaxID=3346970 RepID=UPI003655D2D6
MTAPKQPPAPVCGAEPTAPEPESTAWSQFLDHAMDCADCRDGHRCTAGNDLHDAVRAASPLRPDKPGGPVLA